VEEALVIIKDHLNKPCFDCKAFKWGSGQATITLGDRASVVTVGIRLSRAACSYLA